MKNLIFVFALALTSLTLNAQFGLKAGLNLANINVKGDGITLDTKMLPTFHIGPTYAIAVSENFTINPSLLLTGRGFRLEFDAGPPDGVFKAKSSSFYLQLPVLATYKTEKLYIGAGPYAGYALSERTKADGEDSEKGTIGNSVDDSLAPLDFGINAELGLFFNKFGIGLGYSLGLSDTTPKDVQMDGFSAKNNAITLGLTYMF
jgi:hypothetical protein